MLFSVVVPVYNVEKYLDECIESLTCQSFKDFEVVLVDDGSTDSCPQMCDDYASRYPNIKAVHKANGGLSDARNVGIKNASGDYICFLDSDDWWSTPDALLKIAAAIDKANNPDIVRIETKKYVAPKDIYKNDGPVDFTPFEDLTPEDTLLKMISSDILKEAATLLVLKREYILKYDLFFTLGIKSEDIEWSIRVYSHKPTWGFVSDRIYVYRIGREGSITSKFSYRHLLDCCDSIDVSVERINELSGKIKEALMAFCMYNLVITCANNENSDNTPREKKEVNARLKKVCDKYLLNFVRGKKLKLSAAVYKVGGYCLMCKVLGTYLKFRGR